MSFMQYLGSVGAQLQTGQKVLQAVGAALTPEQQDAISEKLQDGINPLLRWMATPDGAEAVRQLASRFIGADK